TTKQFEKWDKVDARLFEYGISAKQIREKMNEPGFRGLVKAHRTDGMRLTILKAPLDGVLKAGSSLYIRLESPTAQNMLVSANDTKTPLSWKGTLFEVRIDNLPRGLVRIFAQPPNAPLYHSVLEYTVE